MTLPTSSDVADTAARRDQFFAAGLRKFVPFKDPIVFQKGANQ